jgi:dolichol-phosphate mannosyltransferase
VVVLFIGAVQLICVGALGEYVGRIYTTLQQRPTYYIGGDTATAATSPAVPELRCACGAAQKVSTSGEPVPVS